MIAWVFLVVLGLASQLFAARRLLIFLHIFQQEEYDSRRFARWLWAERAYDRRATGALLVLSVLGLWQCEWVPSVALGLAALVLWALAWREPDPRRAAKKKLVLTARARRILWVAYGLVALVVLALIGSQAPLPIWIVLLQAIPWLLMAAAAVLRPYEHRVNQSLIAEARTKLSALHPTIVGVTGSFGKTSVKHILGHVLGMQAPTLVTPGSVNTELGITRIVRENLMARERFFVCEMGAYGVGSIARLCRLAPPTLGIITAVGHAHYERFKTLETVAQAKFELGQSVVAAGGRLIVNESVLDFAPAQAFVSAHRDQVCLVGPSAQADCQVVSAEQSASGMVVTLRWQGTSYRLAAPLYGAHHGLNLALVFAAAVLLGLAPEQVVLALPSTPQIKHRSELRPHPSGAVIIDDAYNSNPSGFAGGLALLDVVRGAGRRILITPGMVELGAAHDAEHAKLGALAAQHVDVLVPVVPQRLTALIEAYRSHAPAGLIVPQPTMQAALAWLETQVQVGDAVLIENDLPDLYENTLRL